MEHSKTGKMKKVLAVSVLAALVPGAACLAEGERGGTFIL